MSAVDSLAIQRSLTNLEERYHKLSLISEERFSNWEAEKTALHQQLATMADSLQESQQQRDQQVANSAILQEELNQLNTAHQSLISEYQAAKNQLAAMADSLQDSQEEAELILQQLQQVQEKLENSLLKNQDLHTAHQSLNSEHQAVKEQLAARSDSLKESQEEAELTLLQLHQVQEELEHYFLKNQEITRKAEKDIKFLRAKTERENAFLRTKVEERDGLISQYRQTVEQLKSVALKSLKPHPFYLQWLTLGSRQRISLGSNQQLLLPPAEST